MAELYFEDFTPGRLFALGSVTLTADEIVAFATQFDPQPFHVDPEAAKNTSFGGLIASGWQTCSLYMRLYVDEVLSRSASEGSPGMEEVRWLAPVRPGDTLTGTLFIEDAKASKRNPKRGTVHLRSKMTNQDGVVVMSMTGRGLFGRRPEGLS
ncbi:MaoC family dehydratase [soil metagenome]